MQVLQLLRQTATPMSITEIAQRLGIHVNTARFHLATLAERAQVERVVAPAGQPGRPPQLFRAVRGMDPQGPRRYELLAEVFAAGIAAQPEPSHRAVETGRLWGRGRAAASVAARGAAESTEPEGSVEQLTAMLDELGFAPERNADGKDASIGLRHCPFLELAVDHADVVCPIHLGLMQGAMQAWRSPLTVDRLEAFVEPGLCLAHLTPVGAEQ